MDENKRTQKRYEWRIDVEITMGADTRTAQTRNISLGGVFVSAVDKPPFGTRVHLRFRVPLQKDPIDVGGTVRWGDSEGYGVQFDGLRARDVWALGKLFEKLPPA